MELEWSASIYICITSFPTKIIIGWWGSYSLWQAKIVFGNLFSTFFFKDSSFRTSSELVSQKIISTELVSSCPVSSCPVSTCIFYSISVPSCPVYSCPVSSFLMSWGRMHKSSCGHRCKRRTNSPRRVLKKIIHLYHFVKYRNLVSDVKSGTINFNLYY